jgi:hypothetical protein
MVAVTDVSPNNDWTEVRVWNSSTRDFGTRTYPTYGFIYPPSSRGHVQQATVVAAQSESGEMIRRHSSPQADPVLATSDRQIAAVLADSCSVSDTVEAKAVETKPVEKVAKIDSNKQMDVASTDVNPAEVKPVEVKSVEAKPAEVKPVEVKSVEAKPAEAKPAEIKSTEAKSLEAKPAEIKVTVVAVNDVKPTMMASAAISNRSSVSANDGIWDGDSAAAKQVGSGRY